MLTSFFDDLGIIRLTADKVGQLNFNIEMSRPEHYAVKTDGNDLLMEGELLKCLSVNPFTKR